MSAAIAHCGTCSAKGETEQACSICEAGQHKCVEKDGKAKCACCNKNKEHDSLNVDDKKNAKSHVQTEDSSEKQKKSTLDTSAVPEGTHPPAETGSK